MSEQPTRRMQVRDVNEPIEGIVREWADREGVPVLRYSELVRDLQSEVGGLIGRAQREAVGFQSVEAKHVREQRDTLLAEVEGLREQLARTQEREARHARIVVEVERVAGRLDGAGPVDGSEVAAQLRAAYRAGAEPS